MTWRSSPTRVRRRRSRDRQGRAALRRQLPRPPRRHPAARDQPRPPRDALGAHPGRRRRPVPRTLGREAARRRAAARPASPSAARSGAAPPRSPSPGRSRGRCSAARRRSPIWRGSPTSPRTTSSPRCCSRPSAAAFGDRGSTSEGVSVAREFAAQRGAAFRGENGSGLSRQDRASPGLGRGPADVDARGRENAEQKALREAWIQSLAVAGRSGTLAGRMRGSAAAGRCVAKTGTITGVSALSGYCFRANGEATVFSILKTASTPPGPAAPRTGWRP